MGNVVSYNASYTGTAFHMAPQGFEYKCIRGPVGSGKSVTCCWDIRIMADNQKVAEVVEDGFKKRIRW